MRIAGIEDFHSFDDGSRGLFLLIETPTGEEFRLPIAPEQAEILIEKAQGIPEVTPARKAVFPASNLSPQDEDEDGEPEPLILPMFNREPDRRGGSSL
jgi:hypothetical protein